MEDTSSTAVLASNSTSDASTSRTNKDSPRRKFKKQSSNQSNTHQPAKYRRQDAKFTYGNYNRYYGYRNPAKEEDCRILGFEREWFDEIFDIFEDRNLSQDLTYMLHNTPLDVRVG